MAAVSSGSEQDAAELRRTSREVAKRLLEHEPSFAASGEVPPAVDDLLREMGYFALTIPEDYGGLNLGALATTAVLAELGSLPLSFFTDVRSNAGVGTRVLARHGSAAQKERWLRAAAAGTARTAFALTEPGAGSDAASIACSAERRGDSYVLNGTKQYITNGQRADIVTVLAYTDRTKGRRGMTAFLVQKGTPGFEVARLERTMAGPPDSVAQLRLTDCVVPADSVLGEVGQGFYYAMENLNEGRLYVAALAVGMARCAQEDASQYAPWRAASSGSSARGP